MFHQSQPSTLKGIRRKICMIDIYPSPLPALQYSLNCVHSAFTFLAPILHPLQKNMNVFSPVTFCLAIFSAHQSIYSMATSPLSFTFYILKKNYYFSCQFKYLGYLELLPLNWCMRASNLLKSRGLFCLHL